MRSIYDLYQPSTVKDTGTGYYFPDVCTETFTKFNFDEPPISYTLRREDIYHPDHMIYQFYGIAELEDIVLTINGISELTEALIGTKILIPTKGNIERYYNTYFV